MEEKDGRALIKTSRGYPSSSGLSSSSDLFFFSSWAVLQHPNGEKLKGSVTIVSDVKDKPKIWEIGGKNKKEKLKRNIFSNKKRRRIRMNLRLGDFRGFPFAFYQQHKKTWWIRTTDKQFIHCFFFFFPSNSPDWNRKINNSNCKKVFWKMGTGWSLHSRQIPGSFMPNTKWRRRDDTEYPSTTPSLSSAHGRNKKKCSIGNADARNWE